MIVTPRREQILQIIMDDINNLINQGDRVIFDIIKNNGVISNQVDFLGSFDCSDPIASGFTPIFKFNRSVSLPTQTFSSSQIGSQNTDTSFQMWVKRNGYVPLNTLTDPTEILFNHDGVTKCSFLPTDNLNMRIDGRQSGLSQTLRFPQNRWMFIQVSSTSSQITATIYDDQSTLEGTSTLTYSSTQTQISTNLYLAQNFNGLIIGIKFYKQATPATNGPHAFTYSIEKSANALIYVLLTTQGQNQPFVFQNIVQADFSRTISPSGIREFAYDFVIIGSVSYTNGNKDGPILFDGYACKDNREKAYLSSDSSYISSSFSTNTSLTQFTVEFWVRLTQTLPGSGYFLSIQSTTKYSQQLYITIMQETSGLMCYPFYEQNSGMKISYLDYVNSVADWMHVACSLVQQNNSLIGQMYQSSQDYVYFTDITGASISSLPKQGYAMYVNANPETLRNGIPKSYYAEIRFWDYARNQNQIRQQRFIRLNTSLEMPNLYSYLKLGYANYNNTVIEIDYADSSLSKLVNFNSVQWIQNVDLLVCPEGYFRYVKDTTCYRQSLLSLFMVVYKNQNSQYVVSPRFSNFRDFYSRDNQQLLFNYQWTLSDTNTQNQTNTQVFPSYFNSQAQNQNLVFGYNQVSDYPGIYDFQITVGDKNDWQDVQQANIRLSTRQCANIFDADTGLSFLYRDMKQTRTVQNVVFTYSYTNCFDYIFDPSSLQFSIDLSSVTLLTSDHNAASQTITLRTVVQSNIPPNDYFYLRIKGVWRNQNNDILEYYLIYGCRFIAKLVLSLSSNYNIATKGDTVTINYDALLANLNQAQVQRTYNLNWICPSQIQSICSQFNNQPLKLYYDQVVNSGVLLFQPQTITLNGVTNFIQGDGTMTSQQSIQLTWINVTPDGDLSQVTPILTQNRDIAFQFSVTSMTESQIDMVWSLSPTVSSTCFINSDDRKQFVIKGSCLNVGTSYTSKVSMYYKNATQMLNSRQISFKLQSLPSGGSFSCNPSSGQAYTTSVTCTAKGWNVVTQPPKYQYMILDNSNKIVAVSPISQFTTATFYPPVSTKIYLRVFDGDNQFTNQSISAQFTASTFSNITSQKILSSLKLLTSQSSQNTDFVQFIQYPAQFLNFYQSQMQTSDTLSGLQFIVSGLQTQYQKIQQFNSTDQKVYFIQGSVQTFYQLSNYSQALDLPSFNTMQEIILGSIYQFPDIYNQTFLSDQEFLKVLFQTQANIIKTFTIHSQKNRLSTLSSSDQQTSTNITAQLRQIFSLIEQKISMNLYEGESFQLNTDIFNISIQKYSRVANQIYDLTNKNNSFLQYSYPLSSALQPTDRQSFTVISFGSNPFVGSFFLNQTALTNSSIYFSYRDQYGNYLAGDNILGQIQMGFKYPVSQVVDLNNKTVCGYIGASDTQWENSSCTTTFDANGGYIYCSCRHMSFYSIIDDHLVRTYIVDRLNFYNWFSLIPFAYMVVIFIFGMIYSYSKDNSDFQVLSKQDNTLGLDLIDGNSLTIKTLLFRRKVFYTGFGQKYSFSTLLNILYLKLHPITQLKYQFDPEIPRFQKFMALYSRIMMMLALSFFVLRQFKDINALMNDPDQIITLIKIFVILIGGSLLFLPLPIFLFRCCRSRYFLIRQRMGPSFFSDDEKLHSHQVPLQHYYQMDNSNNTTPAMIQEGPQIQKQKMNDDEFIQFQKQKDYEQEQQQQQQQQQMQQNMELERFTNVKIDTNLPLKLLFLLDRASTDRIIREYTSSMNYSSGEAKPLAKKLYELDIEINPHLTEQNNNHIIHLTENPNIFYPSNMNNKISQSNTEQDPSDETSNRKLQPNLTPKKMKDFDDKDIQESRIIHGDNQNGNLNGSQFNELERDQYQMQISAVNRGSHSQKAISSLNIPESRVSFDKDNAINHSDIEYDIKDEDDIEEEVKVNGINTHSSQEPKTPNLGVLKNRGMIIRNSQHIEQDGNQNEFSSRSRLDQMDYSAKKLNPNNPNQFTDQEFPGPQRQFGNTPSPHNMHMLDEDPGNNHISKSNTDLALDSFLGSLESQLDADEKKELLEQKNHCGRVFSSILYFIINIGILVAIFYFYVTEYYYQADNNWIWIVVFFGAQFIGFIIFDFLAILIMALCVAKCLRKRKTWLARWMKETLYIYEDYKYIMQFVETRID